MALQVGKQGSKILMRAVDRLVKTEVLVGFPEGGAPRDDKSPLTNAAIAYIQEHGAPEANIPARPFMAPGIETAKNQITAALRRAAQAGMDGHEAGVEAGQKAAGMAAVTSIKLMITDGIDPPLAPKTLAARKRKKFEGETPLLVTGALRDGVTWVLVRGGRKAD
jgi:phage gpG-like protein